MGGREAWASLPFDFLRRPGGRKTLQVFIRKGGGGWKAIFSLKELKAFRCLPSISFSLKRLKSFRGEDLFIIQKKRIFVKLKTANKTQLTNKTLFF